MKKINSLSVQQINTQFGNFKLIKDKILEENHVHIPHLLLSEELKEDSWKEFEDSFNSLVNDQYMKDGGGYRQRRYSVLSWNYLTHELTVEAKQPHYQEVKYNQLNGGIPRHFEMIKRNILKNKVFRGVTNFALNIIDQIEPKKNWHIEAHQFRINASSSESGLPTPEGIHRDGRDHILMMLVNRQNVIGGETTLFDPEENILKNLTLLNQSEAILLRDTHHKHSVSQIKPYIKGQKAYRDVLVVTFYKK